MTPKPTTPVPASPGAVPQPPPQYGIDPDEIAKVSTTWSSSADIISCLDFSSLGHLTGEGSATFSAARACCDPAAEAVKSIGTRVATMASSVSAFARDTTAADSSSADSLNDLTPR